MTMIGSALCFITLTAATALGEMTVACGEAEAAPGDAVDVPITATDAKGLGSLQFDLKYDAENMMPTETPVDAGADLSGAMIESNVVEPGLLRVAMISGEAVNRDGELLTVHFALDSEAVGSSKITVADLRAWDHERNLEMLVKAADGTVTVTSQRSLLVLAGIAAAVVLLVIVLLLIARSSKAKG